MRGKEKFFNSVQKWYILGDELLVSFFLNEFSVTVRSQKCLLEDVEYSDFVQEAEAKLKRSR